MVYSPKRGDRRVFSPESLSLLEGILNTQQDAAGGDVPRGTAVRSSRTALNTNCAKPQSRCRLLSRRGEQLT